MSEYIAFVTLTTSTPTTIAIRQRLNETVYKLDRLRVEQQELRVKSDNLERSHVIAKSDRAWLESYTAKLCSQPR